MRHRTSSQLLPIAAVIAAVTIVSVGFAQAVARNSGESILDRDRQVQWFEQVDSNFEHPQFFAHPDWGRGWRRGDYWGYGPQRERIYDIDTVETVQGTVSGIDTFSPSSEMPSGMHIVVDTGTESLPVHLGPQWFLDEQQLELSVGDEIGITGSRVTFDGQPTLIASEVRHGDIVLELRDRDGIPAWSHWRQQDGHWGPRCW